jgi:CRP/FNR family transcriptional regulator, cyclic AMP receptor protein
MVEGPDSFWAKLGPAERRTVEALAVRKVFNPGEFLFREGDRSRNVVMVRSGHVRVLASRPDFREVIIAIRSAGDVLGELAALDDGPRSATLQALDTVEVLTIPGARFATLCQTEPRLSWALLSVVVDKMRDTALQRIEFGGGSVIHRVAALLLELAVRYGRSTDSGIEITALATQQELASTAATSRESMSRVLRELRGRGVISTGRRRMVIHRMAELRRIAG